MLERISSVYTHIGANNMYPIYSTPSLKKNTIERENGGPACTYKKWKGVCTTWVWTVWALFVATMRHYRAHCVMGQHRRSDGRERELGNNNKSIYREKRVGYLGMKHHLPCIYLHGREICFVLGIGFYIIPSRTNSFFLGFHWCTAASCRWQ
jgi:hypothetical protein